MKPNNFFALFVASTACSFGLGSREDFDQQEIFVPNPTMTESTSASTGSSEATGAGDTSSNTSSTTDSTHNTTSSTGEGLTTSESTLSESESTEGSSSSSQDDTTESGTTENTSSEGDTGQPELCRIGILGSFVSLSSENFETWLQSAGAQASRFGASPSHELTAADLENYDLIILDQLQHVYSVGEQNLLRNWIESGGGFISMAGYENDNLDRDRQNSLISATGLRYVGPIYLDPAEQIYPHPITANIDGLEFYGGWRIDSIPPSNLGNIWMSLFDSVYNPLGVAKDIGLGRAIVYGDEWVSFDDERNNNPGVRNWWINAISWTIGCTITPP